MGSALADSDKSSATEDEEVDESEEGNDDDEDEDEDKGPYGPEFPRRSKRTRRSARGSKRNDSAGEGTASASDSASAKKPKDVPAHFGVDLFKTGRFAQPKNPYFVARIRAKRRDDLYIPRDVVKDHKLEFPSNIVLRDPKGKEWKAKIKTWSDGRTWVSGGWRSLCRWNLVEKEDRLICEILRVTRGKGMILHVSTIVRKEEVEAEAAAAEEEEEE